MCEVYMSRAIESSKLVQGIGFKGIKYPTCSGKTKLKEYELWVNMLRRCTEKLWLKRPTYVGTTCSENFKSYEYFYEWCDRQLGFRDLDEKGKSWQLDKDLLIKNNKFYSEDTCVFIPQPINCLLTKRENERGDYPIGVVLNKTTNKFVARCSDGAGKMLSLGYFHRVEDAFWCYKTFKEAYIKEVANKYKGQIDSRAYQALMRYQVEITD